MLEPAQAAGRYLQPGQGVGYVVVADAKQSRDRVQLPDEAAEYDEEFYAEQLIRAAGSVVAP